MRPCGAHGEGPGRAMFPLIFSPNRDIGGWRTEPVAQSVEHRTFNPVVEGSSPSWLTGTSPSSSQAQDTGLSRRRQGFKSPWGRQYIRAVNDKVVDSLISKTPPPPRPTGEPDRAFMKSDRAGRPCRARDPQAYSHTACTAIHPSGAQARLRPVPVPGRLMQQGVTPPRGGIPS